jgi:cell division protein FtsA
MKRRGVIDFESAYQSWKWCARRREGESLLILDLGRHTVNALYAKVDRTGEVAVLDYSSTVDTGFSEGAVTEPARFAKAVEQVVSELRRRNGIRGRRLNVCISAPFISYFNHFTTVNINSRRRVTSKLIADAVRRAKEEISSLVEYVMQVVPVRFTLDSIYSGGEPPLGMRGQQLGIEIFFLTAPKASLEQIEKALRQCGYSVDTWWYSGLSAAESVLVPGGEAGTAVVEIGSEVTDVAVFHHGRLLHIGVVDRGGGDFDSALATFLNESISVAEEVKRNFGCALPQVVRPYEVIDLRERGVGADKMVSAREVARIICGRAEELLFAVEEEIGKALAPELVSKVILTGGGAKLEGLVELAEMVMDRHVELGVPRSVNGTRMGFSDPSCAALVGTLRLLRQRIKAKGQVETAGLTHFERLRVWLGCLAGSTVSDRSEVA